MFCNTNHHFTVVQEHKFILVNFIYFRCVLYSEYSTSFSIVVVVYLSVCYITL